MASDLRYFEIKVTGCKNCPHAGSFDFCNHPSNRMPISFNGVVTQQIDIKKALDMQRENYFALTPSCPMWNETKEQE